MRLKKFTLTAAIASAALSAYSQSPAANHLVLSEIGAAAPGSAEFTEIYNPTGAPVTLTNYFVSDHNLYFDLPSVVAGNLSNTLSNGSDHLVQFPAGMIIPSGGVVVLCYQGQNFLDVYFDGDLAKFTSLPGNPQLVEVNESHASVPNVAANYNRSSPQYTLPDKIINPTENGNNLNHTDTDENTVLFFWDGVNALVKDLDIVQWRTRGNPWGASTNQISNKSSLLEQGPNGVPASYSVDLGNSDNLTANFPAITPGEIGSGNFIRHSLLEPEETHSGGNGLLGDDETLEQINLTWKIIYGSSSNGSPGLVDLPKSADNQPPVVGVANRNIQFPAPGATVHITCPVYDNGTVQVKLMVAKGNGAFAATNMVSEGGNNYGADISTAGLAEGTLVRYYVTATDTGNLTSREQDQTFYHKPWPGHHIFGVKTGNFDPNSIIVSEVMYNPQGGNNYRNSQYLELYNPANTELDLSGYTIRSSFTDTDGLTSPSIPSPLRQNNIIIPDGTKLPAKGYALIAGQEDVISRWFLGMDLARVVDVDIEPARSFMHNSSATFYFFGPNDFGFNEIPVDNTAAFKTFTYQNNTNGWPQGATGITPPSNSAGDTGYSVELKSLVAGTENIGSNWAISKFYQGSPLTHNSVDTTLRPGDVTLTAPTRSIANPGPADTVILETTTSSSTPIASAALYYSVNYGAFTPLPMTNTIGNTYSASLSGLPDNSLIKYYVEATDTNGAKGTYPPTAPVAFVPFRVESSSPINNIKVSEIMFNPQGDDNKDYPEFFELQNTGSTALDLSYYQYSSGNTQLRLGDNNPRLIPGGTIVQPGGRVLLSMRKSLFDKNYTSPFKSIPRHLYGEIDSNFTFGSSLTWGTSHLVNGGGALYVMHPNNVDYSGTNPGTMSINLTYVGATTGGWPGAGGNKSIELRDLASDPTVGPNWSFSKTWNGTPQVKNSTAVPTSTVSDWTLY